MAMYQVKRNGRNGACFYADGQEPERILYWENEVRRAMAEERLFLVFQPIMSLNTGDVTRCEALLRMTGTDGSAIMPDDFLPSVESLPVMDRIDRWVIQSAIRHLAEPEVAESGLMVGVNLSARAFDDPQLPDTILAWLAASGVAPDRIVFEVTETLAITDLDRANAFIDTLRRSGCRFAIDDFGSGFASFAYLRHLRVDFVKIDGRLVQDLREGKLTMVQGIVAIARGLKLETVAEWVEDAETLELLRECGVDYAQGFLIGHPGPLSAMCAGA
jgi:EAL domain-containing protein (putative c-di-GMP-specific phosphodiesterase class I)